MSRAKGVALFTLVALLLISASRLLADFRFFLGLTWLLALLASFLRMTPLALKRGTPKRALLVPVTLSCLLATVIASMVAWAKLPTPFEQGGLRAAIYAVVFAPWIEEALYRGLLWGILERSGLKARATNIATTLVFWLMHFLPALTWFDTPQFSSLMVQAAYLPFVSLGFGWMRAKHGWSAAWAAHVAFNLVAAIVFYCATLFP